LIPQYLFVLENCFHIELVKPFYSNLRKELTRMPKVYFKDSGGQLLKMKLISLSALHSMKDRLMRLNCDAKEENQLHIKNLLKTIPPFPSK
jgi:hypothetical protein